MRTHCAGAVVVPFAPARDTGGIDVTLIDRALEAARAIERSFEWAFARAYLLGPDAMNDPAGAARSIARKALVAAASRGARQPAAARSPIAAAGATATPARQA